MQIFNADAYGSALAELLKKAPCNELGLAAPDAARRPALAALTPETIVAPKPLVDRPMALCCRAGLWLRFDFFDESHQISQEIETSSGSFWHGILHRREQDFSNAKYWFRRVGTHPVFERLRADVQELAGENGIGDSTRFLVERSEWDPLQFIDLCETARTGPPELYSLCAKIQQREWELLFDFCHAQATGQ